MVGAGGKENERFIVQLQIKMENIVILWKVTPQPSGPLYRKRATIKEIYHRTKGANGKGYSTK